MTPIAWLENNAHGFADLSGEEREAIFHFALLWSFFEARALHTNASAKAIRALIDGWRKEGRLADEAFGEPLKYFRARYFKDGAPTEHFAGLQLRPNNEPELVAAVLQGDNNDPTDCAVATLVVVYRLRNNLFHGIKWAYGIQGQRDNFLNANAALMSALNVIGPL